MLWLRARQWHIDWHKSHPVLSPWHDAVLGKHRYPDQPMAGRLIRSSPKGSTRSSCSITDIKRQGRGVIKWWRERERECINLEGTTLYVWTVALAVFVDAGKLHFSLNESYENSFPKAVNFNHPQPVLQRQYCRHVSDSKWLGHVSLQTHGHSDN